MKTFHLCLAWAFLVLSSGVFFAQSKPIDHLSPEEVAAAVAAKPDTGFVWIVDEGFTTPSLCQAQMPSESVFTPAGWINAMSRNARKQYTQYAPTETDTQRVLTVLSKGCANGSPAGPVCETITRVVLLSDKAGTVTAEAVSENPLAQAWQNGYGASAACSSLVSRFSMEDVNRVRNGKGEFLIATFDGPRLLKIYTVKEKYLKKLGL
jgi:hypothetical protein